MIRSLWRSKPMLVVAATAVVLGLAGTALARIKEVLTAATTYVDLAARLDRGVPASDGHDPQHPDTTTLPLVGTQFANRRGGPPSGPPASSGRK